MSWKQILFGFQGRISRKTYWLVGLGIIVYAVIVGLVVLLALADGEMPLSERLASAVIPLVLLFIPTIWIGLATGVKRLHDRNKSGWWVLLYYWAPGILDQLARQAGDSGWAFNFLSFAITIWGIVELGFRRGTPGPNPYGPDPLSSGPDDRSNDRPDAAVPFTR
jgi:uncharacterized membrane protein YhaH (DUF805 family)